MSDFVDDFFGNIGAQPQQPALGPSPAYDPAVGANASAPFSMQPMMQTDARTGAGTGGAPDFMQILMQLLQKGTPGQQLVGGLGQKFFGDPMKYGNTSNPGQPAPQMQPMQGGQSGAVGNAAMSYGIGALLEMY